MEAACSHSGTAQCRFAFASDLLGSSYSFASYITIRNLEIGLNFIYYKDSICKRCEVFRKYLENTEQLLLKIKDSRFRFFQLESLFHLVEKLLASMARNNYGENFLELGFDWYLVVFIIPKISTLSFRI